MLTPQDITDKGFVKAVFGGYDMSGVDEFLEVVSTDYGALFKENAILKGKLKVLVEKVEEYRSTEDAMRMALLTAQRMGEEITVEANKTKEDMLRAADAEIRVKFKETAARIAEEEMRLAAAAKETARFLKLSQAVMTKHSEFLKKIETMNLAIKPAQTSQILSNDNTIVQIQPESSIIRQEVEIDNIAEQIGNAVEMLTAENAGEPVSAAGFSPPADNSVESAPTVMIPPTPLSVAPQVVPEAAPPAVAPPPAAVSPAPVSADDIRTLEAAEESEEDISPRPKFDFDDLKFGANFDSDD